MCGAVKPQNRGTGCPYMWLQWGERDAWGLALLLSLIY